MSRLLTPFRAEVGAWLLLFAGMVAGIGMITDWGRRWIWSLPPSEPLPSAFVAPPLSAPFRLPPPDKFMEIPLRPLFVVTRRPAPVPPPPEPPKPNMRKNQFTLTGTTIVPEGRFAHLSEKAGNKSRVVTEGTQIYGILVKEVKPDWVILTQYEDSEKLILKTAQPSKTAKPSAPVKNTTEDGPSANGSRPHAWPTDAPETPTPPAGNRKEKK